MSDQDDNNIPGQEGAEGGQAPNEGRRNDEYPEFRVDDLMPNPENAKVFPEIHPRAAPMGNLNLPETSRRVYLTDHQMASPKPDVQKESLHKPTGQEAQQDPGEQAVATDPTQSQEQQPKRNLRSRMKKQLDKLGFGSSRSHGESSRKPGEDEPPPSMKQ